ncbi:MAG: hypothetical protein AB1568_00175 [Thermodesulfobacteriota bacterium]
MEADPKTSFCLLSQHGPFRIGARPPHCRVFAGRTGRDWVRKLLRLRLDTRYRTVRNQIFEFLDIRSYDEIPALIGDRARQRMLSRRAYALLGNMFGIDGSEREVVTRVESYSATADGVIRYLKGKVLANYAPYIEMTNEIDMTSDPVELMLVMFDDRYHKKARFEAKRKLLLMNLAGSIDQRERETGIERKFRDFLDFLNEYVWSQEIRIGELTTAYLVSQHRPEDFSCRAVEVVGLPKIREVERLPGRKITLVKRRRFSVNGREIPIYVSIRKKPSEAKVLKLLRKGEENPAVAVDDELGLMGVVDSVADVKLFLKHLTSSATRAGTLMTLEDISDTLTGGVHRSSSAGSNPETKMFKFFARMGGMRVEFILHSNQTYLDYVYRRGTSHDEYEVKRFFDSGVAEMLFPQDIYKLDMAAVRDELVRWFRHRIEGH